MLIVDEDSWHNNSDEGDDNDGQYEQTEDDKEEEKPPNTPQQSTQEYEEHDNEETECDDVTTNDESEWNKDCDRQFEDYNFKGIVCAQKDVVCNLQENAGIPKSWILLDSQSKVDVFCNARLLNNVRDT